MANQPENKSQLIFYQTEDGRTRLEVRLVNESVWLSLNQMADLFQRDKSVISKHIKNVFDEGELQEGPVVANFATTAADGKTYQVAHFNLDVIISVGYRVKSLAGTQFRIWATQLLRGEGEKENSICSLSRKNLEFIPKSEIEACDLAQSVGCLK